VRRQAWLAMASVILATASLRTSPPLSAGSALPAVDAGAIDAGFQAFWRAATPGDAAKAAERLLRDGVDFDAAWTRLKRGRPYGKAPTGQHIERTRIADNIVEIPESYDPARAWPLRVQLHGGISRDDPRAQNSPVRPRVNRLPLDEPPITILPTGWRDAEWWNTNQVDNILSLVDRVKRAYNVDEARVYMTGVSDGATGAYYFALREASSWSAFLPLNGNLSVLANPSVGADGELFVSNLVNRPFFIVNGGRDPLYPLVQIEPYVDLMRRAGATIVFHPQPLAGHDTSWWGVEQPAFAAFVRDHPRPPYPDRLSWETERVDRANRIDWLVVDALGAASSDTPLEDVNVFTPRAGPARPMFAHRRSSGRVDLVRHGNAIDATTRGVRVFRVLVSPDAFDLSQPLTVVVNGRPVFHGEVTKDPAVLLRWAARDNDRTRLYGAELKIQVP
jgi:predicted esterase